MYCNSFEYILYPEEEIFVEAAEFSYLWQEKLPYTHEESLGS